MKQEASQYQQTLSSPLAACVAVLESVKRFRHLVKIIPSGLDVEIDTTPLDDQTHAFSLTLGGRLQFYGSTFIEARAKGTLQTFDGAHTLVAYDKQILWASVLWIYGIIFVMGMVFALGCGSLVIALGTVLLIGTNIVLEVRTARQYLEYLSMCISALNSADW